MKAKLSLQPNTANINIDGYQFEKAVTGLIIEANPGKIPKFNIDLLIFESEIEIEGVLSINATPISDEIGLAVYNSLKARYES